MLYRYKMWTNNVLLLLVILTTFLVEHVTSHSQAFYLHRAQTACSVGYSMNETYGKFSLQSLGRAGYPANLDCRWSVVAPQNTTITITFISFDVRSSNPACSRDYVKVLDRGNEVEKFCTPGNKPKKYYTYTTISNNVTILFHSYEYKFGGKGIFIKWSMRTRTSVKREREPRPLSLPRVTQQVEDSSNPRARWRGRGKNCVANCSCSAIRAFLQQREDCSRCLEEENVKCGGGCALGAWAECAKSETCPGSPDKLQPSAIEEDDLEVITCRGCVDRCETKSAICGFPNVGWKYKLSPPLSWQESRDWCQQNFKGDLAVEGLRNHTLRLQIMSYLGVQDTSSWVGLNAIDDYDDMGWVDGSDFDPTNQFMLRGVGVRGQNHQMHLCGVFDNKREHRYLSPDNCKSVYPGVCAAPCKAP